LIFHFRLCCGAAYPILSQFFTKGQRFDISLKAYEDALAARMKRR
jgi:hypothetical protein